jgi:adenylate cyclase
MSLKRRLAAIIFAFIGLAVATFISSLGIGSFTEHFFKSKVFAMRGELKPDTRILIAGIGEQDIKLLEDAGVYYPFPRNMHADLIRKLADAGAKAVVFDILFSTEPFDVSEDEALRDAILYARKRGTTVILACALEFSKQAGGAADIGALVSPTETIMQAQPLLATANTQPKLSYKETESGETSLGGVYYYSQSLQAFSVVQNLESEELVSSYAKYGLSPQGAFIINYFGPDGTIQNVSYASFFPELLEKGFAETQKNTNEGGGATQSLEMSKFKDSVVFVGSRAKADNDYFMTPFGEMFGVETNAQALNTLLTGKTIRDVNPRLVLALVLLLTLLSWAFTAWLRPIPSFAAFTALLILFEASIVLAFTSGLVLMPFTYPTATLFLSFFFSLSFRVLTEEAEKRRIRATFSRYMAPDIVKEIIDNPDLADLGGNDREVALLFSDIRNYSTISEKLDPHQTVEFLNRYLTEISDIIMRNSGFVDKFMGDGVMAIFGAPVKSDNPCADAVRSALEMVEMLVDRMGGIVAGMPVPHFRVGIGIHYGHVIMGNVGSAKRMDYTCIGDVVNVASRLESETKHFGTAILISDDVQEKIGDEFILELLGETMVKGRTAPVKVYKVLHERGLEMTDITQFLPGGTLFPSRPVTPDTAPEAP